MITFLHSIRIKFPQISYANCRILKYQIMAGVCRHTLNSLQLNTQNTLIVGIIIHTKNSKTFESNPDQYRGGTRAVWAFTLRDSEEDFINVTVWGDAHFVEKLTTTFHIGSIVDVINAKIVDRHANDKNEHFSPNVSSPFALVINESSALLQLHEEPDRLYFERLLQIPTKDISQVRTIKSIVDVIDKMEDQFVDLLVVVGESRSIMTRDGRNLVSRQFEVGDGSCRETLPLMLWEHGWITMSESWEPKNTVLFIADAFIGFDKYKKKTAVSIARKTLITENPDLPQAIGVRNSIRCESDYMPQDPFAVPNPETIKNVMTIKDISAKLNEKKLQDGNRMQFVTKLYASVTEINMESVSRTGALMTRCALCKRMVAPGNDSCMNLDCPCGNGRREPTNTSVLYLRLNLKDETGYLIGCRLTGPAAERALNCTVAEFSALNLEERSELKWRLHLEQCDVRLQVLGATTSFPRTMYNILSIKRVRDCEQSTIDHLDELPNSQ